MHFNSDIILYRTIGSNIKYYREQAKLTQVQLAEQAKISLSYLSKIEAAGCNKSLSISVLNQLANVLDVEISEFLRRYKTMPRTPNTHGGGAQTNRNGLHFEQTTSLDNALINAGYNIINHTVYRGLHQIGMSVLQKQLYTYFLNPQDIYYYDYNSKEWRPDEAFINFENNTVYIVEKKFQNCAGSVDEKLPGCHFKKYVYQKLFQLLHFSVEFVYMFNEWFLDERYRDTLDYITNMGCYYFYNEIPLDFLDL